MERTQTWLESKLDQIWELLFPEMPRKNTVIIQFKGKSKYRFGHIKLKEKDTHIVINSLFKHELVPEYIIDITIAHELVHYLHGFNSPLPQLYRYPHQGNIVNKELIKKGFAHQIKLEKQWIKKEWIKIYNQITSKES
ncbi:MAG: hypothetical protein CMH62_00020 [Nanoarchaeota archaeon]|nr:hypothetical protein [Nanoarchaeota archaeon]|tara:strand:+ start:970 stop:1383 length:414 start_codon:yes stop_codon:yes gene_type:complete